MQATYVNDGSITLLPFFRRRSLTARCRALDPLLTITNGFFTFFSNSDSKSLTLGPIPSHPDAIDSLRESSSVSSKDDPNTFIMIVLSQY